MNKDYKQGYQDGVKASCSFLIDGHDLPTIAEEIKKWVMPNRNWRKRFLDETGIKLRRRQREGKNGKRNNLG